MDTSISPSEDVSVGQVFTPLRWAEWLVTRWGILDGWLAGACVCDPTAGRGVFALALLKLAIDGGLPITPALLSRLTLIERRASSLAHFRAKALRDYGVEYPPSSLFVHDVITDPHVARYDILIGNPPWSNFADLPSTYKQQLKPHFVAAGLVPDKRRVLLGSSRTDIAALVLKVVLGRLLRRNGMGCFFLPLSLFSGDDAHVGFRDYLANDRHFCVDEVCEFTSTKVFQRIGTSYCCARFRMDVPQKFPVRYLRESGGRWVEHAATPLRESDDPWRVMDKSDDASVAPSIAVPLSPQQKPRQGVNTCGANAVFLFRDKPARFGEEFLFPVATKETWRSGDAVPRRWILLPHDRKTGKPLSWTHIEKHDGLRKHLNASRLELESRKGTLIRSAINRGFWWSLLGVGPYCFAPYKVIWEAYGRSNFRPIILHEVNGQAWQGNQAMHAFIPCWSLSDAERIQAALENPAIVALLRQLNGHGKCNWAQPGKMKKVLSFDRPAFRQRTVFDCVGEALEHGGGVALPE